MRGKFNPEPLYIRKMADGTVKQINPFTGIEVWTVPDRGHRPLTTPDDAGTPLDQDSHDAHCAFCIGRAHELPPEKSRLVTGAGGAHTVLRGVLASELLETVPEFRRVPNLFEIVSYDYWVRNFQYRMPEAAAARMQRYIAEPCGREHVLDCIDVRLKQTIENASDIDAIDEVIKLDCAKAFFGGGHELIIARRHYIDGAVTSNGRCGSGNLSADEHHRYINFTVDALRDIFETNRHVRYVAVFQNWLKPAGASFDHLHKQLVAIDERGAHTEMEIGQARTNPNVYNEAAVNYAVQHNLVFAENEHAIAFAGFGHRFPALEIYSKSRFSQPWEHSPDELRAMSDLVHACHAAMGASIPCNEEWHYKPPDADVAIPWRVVIKWRISNPAGFEGGTYIYVNTIDPHRLRATMIEKLLPLRNSKTIAPIKIGEECDSRANCLLYNPTLRGSATGA